MWKYLKVSLLSLWLAVLTQASVGGFCRELGVGRDEALNLIGRSVALAKQARQWYTDHHVKKVSNIYSQ